MRSVAPHPRAVVAAFALGKAPSTVTADMRATGHLFESYEAFQKVALDPRAFLVDADDDAVAEALLLRLRSDPAHWLKPIFLAGIVGPRSSSLADGVLERLAEAAGPIDAVAALVRTLPSQEYPPDKEVRLLRYLYTRPELVLLPVKDWRHPSLYFFPLLAALARDDTGSALWLWSLRSRGLLEPVELIDRLRICPHCLHPHLTFIDVCPNCSSIAIAEKPFLHCYTCGNVGPQAEFVQGGVLVCLKCHATLRHIGVDYDRALENFCCDGCGHAFTEPRIDARCLQCSKATASDDLTVRRIESVRLTAAGRLAARSGSLAEVASVLDELNYSTVAYFRHTLDWLIALSRRHQDIRVGLVCVRLANLRELVEQIGRNRVMLVLDGLATRLRELIRTTDIATRTSEEHFWLLLPQTPEASCRVVLERIRGLAEHTRQEDGSRLEVKADFVVVPDHVSPGENAEYLMARLQSGLS